MTKLESENLATGLQGLRLKVGYGYEDGTANTIRPTTLEYPHAGAGSAATLVAGYSPGIADALSRPDRLRENGAVLQSVKYVGLSMLVTRKYDAADSTELTYGGQGDAYAGYDRFGRIVRTLWKHGTDEPVDSKYGRDTVGNVLWRQDLAAAEVPAADPQDDFYWYDGLRQVVRHDRGTLAPPGGPFTGVDPATRTQQAEIPYVRDVGQSTSVTTKLVPFTLPVA